MSSWQTPGFFDVLDDWAGAVYGPMVAGSVSYADAQRNSRILQNAIWAAQIATETTCGDTQVAGEVVIPGHSVVPNPVGGGGLDLGATYFLAVPPIATNVALNAAIVIDCNWPLKIRGTGNCTLSMMPDPNTNNVGDMFAISTGGGPNSGGVTFEDLTLEYQNIPMESSPPPLWAAIHTLSMGGSQNIRAVRCVFQDCPIGVWAQDGLQISILECLITYSKNTGIGIYLGSTISGDAAKEVFITDCLFAGGAGPAGLTGMLIQGCDEVFVSDCHINGFTDGIAIKPGPTGHNAIHLHFSGCTVNTSVDVFGNLGHCCIIQPQPLSGGVGNTQVAQVVFTSCFFEPGLDLEVSSTGGGPGVWVDATYGAVDNVRFVSCHSLRWPGQGLKITGATGNHLQPTNIEVLGGMYSGNNFEDFDAPQSCGILVSVANGIRISGVSCLGVYNSIAIGSSGNSPTQDTGIYVGSNASDVTITGCDCRLNNVEGIHIDAASRVTISGCNVSTNGASGAGTGILVNGAVDATIDGCKVVGNIAYGILVNSGSSDVNIVGCDVRANGTNGIKVDGSSTVTRVQVRDCNAAGYSAYNVAVNMSGTASNMSTCAITDTTGYNDRGQGLTGAFVTGTPFENYTFGYWGPVEFYITIGAGTTLTALSIDSHSLPIPAAGSFINFLLVPGETATISFTPSIGVVNHTQIGK